MVLCTSHYSTNKQCHKGHTHTHTFIIQYLVTVLAAIAQLRLRLSAMSAPPIAIFAHDKKADSHSDPRAWLKTRVSSPPQKAHPLMGHSPVHRKGADKVDEQATMWNRCLPGTLWILQVQHRPWPSQVFIRTLYRLFLSTNNCPDTRILRMHLTAVTKVRSSGLL